MNYIHSLSFNLPSETEEATRLLYELNPSGNFKHLIVDLGFPLEYGADYPTDIDAAKKANTEKLKRIAKEYGSEYVRFANIGVSQNWTQVFAYLKEKYNFGKKDVLTCCDPDERPSTKGWVDAIGEVLGGYPNMAACCLVMPEQLEWLRNNHANYSKSEVRGHKIFVINGVLSMAQLGFSGRYLIENGGVPVPENWGIYGHIESAFVKSLRRLNMQWCILEDYLVTHTECSTVYRAWKTDITSGEYIGDKQVSFELWLRIKQKELTH